MNSTPQSAAHDATVDPSTWVVRFAPLARTGGSVLDVACGRGRHSRFFAARGCRVTALDRDRAALQQIAGVAGVTTLIADLEAGVWPLGAQRFDVVVVTNYLHRVLFPRLLHAVKDDGLLLYETFAEGNEAYGKPSNPNFLLKQGELLRTIGDALTVVAFEQGAVLDDRPAVMQRLAAVGRLRPWPPQLP